MQRDGGPLFVRTFSLKFARRSRRVHDDENSGCFEFESQAPPWLGAAFASWRKGFLFGLEPRAMNVEGLGAT